MPKNRKCLHRIQINRLEKLISENVKFCMPIGHFIIIFYYYLNLHRYKKASRKNVVNCLILTKCGNLLRS